MLDARTIIFDVEGTLVNCVAQTINCWVETLAAFGIAMPRASLQDYSGCDGGIMLKALLPEETVERRREILQTHEQLYERKYLKTVQAFEGVKDLFLILRSHDYRLAIGTTCKATELAYYDHLLGVIRLCAVVACGSDVKRGKPYPDLFEAALAALGSRAGFAVGDTPFDAMAAKSCGLVPMGVLTGGFSRARLMGSGCAAVGQNLSGVLQIITDASGSNLIRTSPPSPF